MLILAPELPLVWTLGACWKENARNCLRDGRSPFRSCLTRLKKILARDKRRKERLRESTVAAPLDAEPVVILQVSARVSNPKQNVTLTLQVLREKLLTHLKSVVRISRPVILLVLVGSLKQHSKRKGKAEERENGNVCQIWGKLRRVSVQAAHTTSAVSQKGNDLWRPMPVE